MCFCSGGLCWVDLELVDGVEGVGWEEGLLIFREAFAGGPTGTMREPSDYLLLEVGFGKMGS